MVDIEAEGFDIDGPFDSSEAAYEDENENYVTSEPTIDGTANSIFVVAALSSG
ncbi:MAG: hypothetical protein SGJ13_14905 [Actinomycetota bacterium]|nr:hypothetical protein [Actinomycetota bacterium]